MELFAALREKNEGGRKRGRGSGHQFWQNWDNSSFTKTGPIYFEGGCNHRQFLAILTTIITAVRFIIKNRN